MLIMRSGDDNCVMAPEWIISSPPPKTFKPLSRILFQFMRRGTGHGDKFPPATLPSTNPERENAPCFPFHDTILTCHFGIISFPKRNQPRNLRCNWTQPKTSIHGKPRCSQSPRRLFQIHPPCTDRFFRCVPLSATQMMMMARPWLSNKPSFRFRDSSFDDPGLFELLEATVGRNQVTGARRQSGKGFLG